MYTSILEFSYFQWFIAFEGSIYQRNERGFIHAALEFPEFDGETCERTTVVDGFELFSDAAIIFICNHFGEHRESQELRRSFFVSAALDHAGNTVYRLRIEEREQPELGSERVPKTGHDPLGMLHVERGMERERVRERHFEGPENASELRFVEEADFHPQDFERFVSPLARVAQIIEQTHLIVDAAHAFFDGAILGFSEIRDLVVEHDLKALGVQSKEFSPVRVIRPSRVEAMGNVRLRYARQNIMDARVVRENDVFSVMDHGDDRLL